MTRIRLCVKISLVLILTCSTMQAQTVDPEIQKKINTAIELIQIWAASTNIVDAVQTANATPSSTAQSMTQEKWQSTPITADFPKSLTSNSAAKFMRIVKTDMISEMFLSASNGTKVAFLSKTSFWSHAGKAKHDAPMAGKVWQGPMEIDESTGAEQVQVSVPIKDGDKPIGSLVVGLRISKLK